MTKVLGILLYIVAGFFLNTVCILGFLSDQDIKAKLIILGIFVVIAAVPLLIGLACMGGNRKWKRQFGIIFVSVSGYTAFEVLLIVWMFTNEEFVELMPRKPDLELFSGIYTGTGIILGLAVVGSYLLYSARKSGESAAVSNATP